MHAPASVNGLRRRLAVPAALRRRPGMPRGPLLVAAAVLAGLAVLAGVIVVYTPLAHPKTLVVTGVTGPSEGRITRLLEEAGAKQSTFAVSDEDLMRAVAAYPEVAGIEVSSHPPSRLEIHAIMRLPVGRIEIGGRAFIVAADGTILQRAAGADVPRLDASIGDVSVRGGHLTGAHAVLQILSAAPEPLLAIARTVRVGHAGVEIEMSRGPRLVFGSGAQAADKWAAAAAVIADGSAEAATYIDLRVPARPAVGGIGGTKDAGSADPPTLTAGATNATGTTSDATATGTSTGAGAATGSTGSTGSAGSTSTGATSAATSTGAATTSGQATNTTGATGATGTAAAPSSGTTAAPSSGTSDAQTGTAAPAAGTGGAALAPTP